MSGTAGQPGQAPRASQPGHADQASGAGQADQAYRADQASRARRGRRHPRPWHPPFTHFPIAAYFLAAGFDLASVAGGSRHQWAGQLWHAGTFVLVGGLAICLLTMTSGFADLVRFSEHAQHVVRVIAAHVCVMAGVFMLGVVDLALRISAYQHASTPPGILVLTLAAAVGVGVGGQLGGTLVYRHRIGVAAPDPAPAPQTGSTAGHRARPTW